MKAVNQIAVGYHYEDDKVKLAARFASECGPVRIRIDRDIRDAWEAQEDSSQLPGSESPERPEAEGEDC